MSIGGQSGEEQVLFLKTVTWQKDSHSLFDYQSNKNVTHETFSFSLSPKFIYLYRNNQSCEISYKETKQLECLLEPNAQLLGCIHLKEENSKLKLDFYGVEEVKAKSGEETARTNSSNNPGETSDQNIYLIVRSLKNKYNQSKGYKLQNGQIIKLGRVEYRISTTGQTETPFENKTKFWTNNKKIIVEQNSDIDLSKAECKYCYMGQTEEHDGFLCSPCSCKGSCALVHFRCLQRWNQSKVKKEVVGSTAQYNFEKFYCEVCKDQYPRFIQNKDSQFQLLPIDKPKGDHIILEGISEKANNMMVIEDISEEGIKLGRGHQCQIRITDISVSRTHARIQKIKNNFYIFDNKSKFGTLVRESRLSLQLSSSKQGVQIGRTVITLQRASKK